MKKLETDRIKFHFQDVSFHFPNRTTLKKFIYKVLVETGKSIEMINYIFCSDEHLLTLNQQYLKHDTYTDIVTFELSDMGDPIISDIYISVERVRENAQSFNVSFKSELHRVVFHGALHLAGFGDKTSKEAKVMRREEEELLRRYFVPRETLT